ncbi:glycosyl hydrolase family 71-domain-containing protein [Flammula alnicola]|nr:glycosyl hydrolase family 71-domain-containing protein [Flammula alnicola]
MRVHFFQLQLFALALFLSSSIASNSLNSDISVKRKRNWSIYSNRTVLHPENPAELQKRDGAKYVFMHHYVLFSLSYFIPSRILDPAANHQTHWLDDMNKIAAKGIDAIALNIGGDDWQRTQVDTAYQAAKDSGTGIKLFYSFDLTEMACNLDDLVARVNKYSSHPNQFKVNGKVMISSYSGDCLGDSGWANLKAQTNGYLMPFIWGLEGKFNQWPSLDSWYCWGCAWPQGNYDKNTDDDNYYIGQLGTKYATTISGWMYTHLSSKNFYLRGDDWLIVNRWEQLMQMRNTLTFVEMVTWNDWGESDYFGPFKGAQPAGTFWAENFPHTAWFDLSQYYIKAFQTGSYPAITQSVIYFWARPHPAAATASGDSLGKPTGWDWSEDSMWAAVYSTAPAIVILKCGSQSSQFSVGAGVSKLKSPLSAGKMTVQMIRSGQTIINYTPDGYTYVTNPVLYNYNAWVGSATATSEGGTTSPTSASSSTSSSSSASSSSSSSSASSASSSSSSSSTSTSSSAIATTTTSAGWNYVGCYQDAASRTLSGLSNSDSTQTVSKCLASCQAAGYQYAGVEYGVECYCSNAITIGALAAPESDCSMPCAGKSSDKCGAGWRLNVYKYTSTGSVSSTTWSDYGCVAEGTTGTRRALTASSFQQSNMTPLLCQSLCSGYTYAGVEDGNQCFCGNSLTNNGASDAVVATSNCQSNCVGDTSKKCGGSWYLNVFEAATTTANTITTTGSTTTTTTSTTTTSASSTPTSTAWNDYGCVAEGTTGTRRALTAASYSQTNMTPQLCQSLCAGYLYAGTENGNQCFCGNTMTNNGASGTIVSSSNCQANCGGDSSKKCGGSWNLSVYTKVAIPQWTSAGCYVDASTRLLRGSVSLGLSGLTAEKCFIICSLGGFTMAATENGQECFCGSQLYKEGGAGVLVDSSQCNQACSGNSSEMCGAGWRANLYLQPGTTLP